MRNIVLKSRVFLNNSTIYIVENSYKTSQYIDKSVINLYVSLYIGLSLIFHIINIFKAYRYLKIDVRTVIRLNLVSTIQNLNIKQSDELFHVKHSELIAFSIQQLYSKH